MMGSFVYFFILLIILQVLSPLLYAIRWSDCCYGSGSSAGFCTAIKNSAKLSTKRSSSNKIITSSNSRTPVIHKLNPARTSMKKM